MIERIVTFSPAYDKRPKYGVHGVELRMVLKGTEGAVQFVLYTKWQLPHVTKETDESTALQTHDLQLRLDCFYHPQPAYLGYHSLVPRYEGQTPVRDSCEYLDGKPCYYGGSGLAADRIYEVLLREGSDGVWRELEAYYAQTFEDQEVAK
jgi:hypothetical protein